MAFAKRVVEVPKFNPIELIIENQEELDVLIAFTGNISTRLELSEHLREALRLNHTPAHVRAQFDLYNALKEVKKS